MVCVLHRYILSEFCFIFLFPLIKLFDKFLIIWKKI